MKKKLPPPKEAPSVEKGWVKSYGYWWPPQRIQRGRETRMMRFPQWRIEMLCYWGCIGQAGGKAPRANSEGAITHLKNFIDEIWNWEGSPFKFLWTPMAVQMLEDSMIYKRVSLAGSASSGKSQFGAIWALANFLISSHNTKVFITSTTLDESRQRIWGVIERYWHAAAAYMELQGFPMPGKLTSSRGFITGTLDGKPSKLVGLALLAGGKGQDKKAATKIGFKSPRMFIVADELPVLTTEFSESLANLSSNKNVHMIGIGNPKSYLDPFGMFSEPENGWSSITENDYFWLTKEGGCCRRFNAERSPNYEARKEIWVGLATFEYVENMKSKYGEDSPDYWRFVKAFWSPTGDKNCIYCEKEIYDSGSNLKVITPVDVPQKLAFLDPAFTAGGDRAVAVFGLCGIYENKAARRNQKYLQTEEFVDLKKRVRVGEDVSKRIIELYQEECEKRGIPLKNRGVDITGGGIPFASFMAEKMGRGFVEVSFGGKASKRTMSRTDTKHGTDRYYNRVTELWYAGKELLRGGNIKCLSNPDCILEMTSRTSERVEKEEIQVEPKSKMKARSGGRSPDCFVAGTMILTPHGEVPVENLNQGDLVMTPFGPQPILVIHCTEVTETTSVSFSNGKTLTGKGSHKIFTWDDGWVRLDALSLRNECESAIMLPLWKFLNSFFTKVENTDFKPLVDTIKIKGRLRRRDFFTAPFGRTLMDTCRKAWRFITKTETGETTPLKSSNWLKDLITDPCICEIDGRILLLPRNSGLGTSVQSEKQCIGINLQKEKHGIESMESALLEARESLLPRTAWSVDFSSTPRSKGLRNSAQADAEIDAPAEEQKTLKGVARFAGLLSSAIDTVLQKRVRINAEPFSRQKLEKVYNLTLLEENVYYANGILVQNCADAFFGLIEVARQVCGLTSDARALKVVKPVQRQEDKDFTQFDKKHRHLPTPLRLKGSGLSWGLTGSFKRAQMFGAR